GTAHLPLKLQTRSLRKGSGFRPKPPLGPKFWGIHQRQTRAQDCLPRTTSELRQRLLQAPTCRAAHTIVSSLPRECRARFQLAEFRQARNAGGKTETPKLWLWFC